ncbi:unnamed protein product [Pseudo-nitzschia multistriata]|uniref:Fe2OG dioxygenase domain-containing protein n=1 Tax=Pseudo-nitzschia multistriata TaxID=183589 RepID=A0A448YV40_9STRA|nr:unnamed protein product [Pseudo-nitzschia multistriata]
MGTSMKEIICLFLLCFLVENTFALSPVVAPKSESTVPKTSNPSSKWIGAEKTMREYHAAEVAGGKDAFGSKTSDENNVDDNVDRSSFWSDENFITYSIGENNAGIDATYLPKNGNSIFESRSSVVTGEECRFIVEEARETIVQGLIDERQQSDDNEPPEDRRVNAISNSQLGEARLSRMPKTRAWLKEALQTRFYPLLKNRFGVDDIVLYDGLVLGNLAPTMSQPIHRDASLLTINVALSALDDYEGGGTYIEALDEVLTIDQGHLLCHAGSAMHAGNAISKGERWVFVLFLLGEQHPQLARRCHAEAIEHTRRQELDEAEAVLQTGLKSIAPNHDHLLHNTMGRLHMMKGEHSKAFRSFQNADSAYPICQNAMVSMAQLLVDRRRPRAALRRFDTVLERIGDRDLDPSGPAQLSQKSLAYGARRDAARCALVCADHLYRSQVAEQEAEASPPTQSTSTWELWTLRHLPTAIQRLKTCLAAAPNEPTLLGMLNRAEFLLAEAEPQQKP